jgi:hypothetical protein
MGADLAEVAAWTGLAASVAAFLWHGIMHAPMRASPSRTSPLVETFYAYFALLLATLVQIVRFLAEAREHGLYDGRPDGTTSWVRPVGAGVAWFFQLSAFSMLSKSGSIHYIGVTSMWLATAVAVLVAALVPEHDFDSGSFMLLASACATVTIAFLWLLDYASQKNALPIKATVALGIVVYVLLSGIDLVNPHLAPTALMSWLFTVTTVLELCFFLLAYFDSVEMHLFKWLLYAETAVPVSVISGVV